MSTDATRRPRQAGEQLTFGVLCPVVGGFYFGRSLAGIARVLRAHGHRVVALQTYPADLDRDEFPGPPGRRPVLGRSSFDGFVVNNLTGLKVSVPANGEIKLNPRWCSATSAKHTAQHTFSGTDANGNSINLQTPVINLMAAR